MIGFQPLAMQQQESGACTAGKESRRLLGVGIADVRGENINKHNSCSEPFTESMGLPARNPIFV